MFHQVNQGLRVALAMAFLATGGGAAAAKHARHRHGHGEATACLQAAVVGEARGKGPRLAAVVVQTIRNRMAANHQSACAVVYAGAYAPKQGHLGARQRQAIRHYRRWVPRRFRHATHFANRWVHRPWMRKGTYLGTLGGLKIYRVRPNARGRIE